MRDNAVYLDDDSAEFVQKYARQLICEGIDVPGIDIMRTLGYTTYRKDGITGCKP
jgi:hypothetical protein